MDIVRIFKSKTRKALLRLYFTNPEAEYYLRELERLLGIPVSMLRKELLCLEADGIFSSYKKANLVYFRVNKSYPLFSEFKSIILKTVGAEGFLRQAMEKIDGVEFAFIFGSFARNAEEALSDIDICIIGRIDEDVLLRRIKEAERVLQREINYTIYTHDEFKRKKARKDSFILDLLENQKIFLKGEKNGL